MIRLPAKRLMMIPARRLWRVIPMPVKHRLWPYVLRAKGIRPPVQRFASEAEWPQFAIGGQDVAFPPLGSAPDQLCAEFVHPGAVASNIIVFGPIDWSFRLQRPQKLALELSKLGNRVFYVNPGVAPSTQPGVTVTTIAPGLFTVTLHSPTPIPPYDGALTLDQAQVYLESLRVLRQRYAVLDAWTGVMLPFWTQLAISLRETWGWPVWYDRMDHWKGFERVGAAFGAAEDLLLEQADCVTATATSLLQASRPITLVPNACDSGFAALPAKRRSNSRTVGYVGAIAEWFDVELVLATAELPDVRIELYGAVSPEANVDRLRSRPNVTFHGEIPHSAVCDAMDSLDVCLLPFDIRPLTESTDPVKVYEYLARGKAVVASPLPELARFTGLVSLASTPAAFASAVAAALRSDDPSAHARRVDAVAKHTWGDRAVDVSTSLNANTPLVSVVILNWNNAALTAASIRLLLQVNTYARLDVICVDNGSAVDDVIRLRQLVADLPMVTLVENASNLGFAGGMNSGVDASCGDVIVLLNNDCFIGPGGIEAFEMHLRDTKVGLVGAVTNWTGNEAKIEINPTSLGAFLRVAVHERLDHSGESATVRNVAFFCVAFRRSVWEHVGSLDTRFGVGMFEDDDYCRRIASDGFAIRIARDAFVYHIGEASFSTLRDDGTYQALFSANKAIFEAKWNGPWTPHTYSPLQTQIRAFARRIPLPGGAPVSLPTDRLASRVASRVGSRLNSLLPGAGGEAMTEASLRFQCNICSTWCSVPVTQLGREVPNCPRCQSTARLRAMARCLSLATIGEVKRLDQLPKSLRGIGLSDHPRMATYLSRYLDYENTSFHQEPLLDITRPLPTRMSQYDFVLSSDVFEHVLPPVQLAFDGAFSLLKPGGWLILSIPCMPVGTADGTVEHFPELHEWRIEKGPDGHRSLINTTTSGQTETFTDLVYHGGDGETLEMRLFEERSVVRHLEAAGFHEVSVRDESDLTCGIAWGNQRFSVPFIARRPPQ